MTNVRKLILIIGIFVVFTMTVQGVQIDKEGKIIPDHRGTENIVIDGDLNEDIWEKQPISKQFQSFDPTFGVKSPDETHIWMAYDSKNLYFAFKCNDDQPDNIKTSITQRDNIFDDDFVGVAIDTTGSKQTAYEFFVNPNGIQGDKLTTAFSFGEVAPDFVWYSAGKITKEGYQVEIRIPLKSLRYKSGKHVPMGVLFTRSSPKTGTRDSWPLLKASSARTIFPGMKPAIYKGLKSQLNL
ncbi:MAG: carbohydrate binding family 9 domain-containing protein, partial [bacterium]|nr:carbohydrate binding family 9 domain-containing protein [bacterium]